MDDTIIDTRDGGGSSFDGDGSDIDEDYDSDSQGSGEEDRGKARAEERIILVTGVPDGVNDDDLRNHFRQWGDVVSLQRFPGRAVVEFVYEASARACTIAEPSSQQLKGAVLTVKIKPRSLIVGENDVHIRPQHLRITTPFLTKYERARVLGTRALQISMGAPLKVDPQGEADPLIIASKELREKLIPFIIRRHLPDGGFEDWPLNDLVIDMDRTMDNRYKNLGGVLGGAGSGVPDLRPA
eukprot:TRINITY_DN46966_c0_g1_i1.p2 TRINITY_DN46966_c0_g1~~TRINITY_DN46966_c0_g1_i1.p2  ORF type:complete len:271 (+),score=90.95 TRINITY_DN46966_c0_g1_i1:94-813(+)